ncbi:unnamed protein product [Ilex paraguariensis]|uniref:Uncharacterized protein n=1 Tax=Ilex paraguariensis TaxID=185542 RepID=A0ABC8U2F1_9AQUA
MKLEILSRKLIKPSVPTPHQLRQKKISVFDQLAPPSYTPLVLHYSANGDIGENAQRRAHLERSLSAALTTFYPLAGRFNTDNLSIECNDEGVAYLEAQVGCKLDEFLLEPKIELLNHLLPSDIEIDILNLVTSPLLAIQINSFNCGGLAIGLYFSHKITDASAVASFIITWASSSQAEVANETIHQPNFDLGSLFPPITGQDISLVLCNPEINVVTRRFVFNGAAITKLKANAQALAQIQTNVPPLPEILVGNFVLAAIARFKADENKMELHDLVGLIRDETRDAIAKFTKLPVLNGNEVMQMLENICNECLGGLCNSEVDVRGFSSWCRFPLYKADFGWGKPNWVSLISCPAELVFLLDTNCGEGIEAWVNLNEQDMIHFQQDPDIVAFSS